MAKKKKFHLDYGASKSHYAVFNKDRFLANLEAGRRIGEDIISCNIYVVAVDDQ